MIFPICSQASYKNIRTSLAFIFVASSSFQTVFAAPGVSIDKASERILIVTDTYAIQLQPWSSGTIRVEAAPGTTIPDKKSFAAIATPNSTGWEVIENPTNIQLKGARLSATVDKQTGLVSFQDASGGSLFKQSAWSFAPAHDATRDGLEISASFQRATDEHFYGGGVLGDELRRPKTEIALANNNTQVRIPVLYSSRSYGFFWDNSSQGKLSLTSDLITWESSAGDLADFYVFAGPTADAAVSEYRNLTGAAPLFPKWAYGFWFSKNKFNSQKEILDAAEGFKTHQFPIDLIIQDYFYWKPNGAPNDWTGWGSHHFVEERYPNPKAMIDQLHNDDHIHFMTVIWPRLDQQTDHALELDHAHVLFPNAGNIGWDQGTRFYDPFAQSGRDIYGRQVMESLLPLGVDAFWMDAAEPEMRNNVFAKFDSITGPVSRLMDAYPLMHTTAVYDAQRKNTSQKRVVLLPRSSWAGEQRNAAANWTGDIHQDWKTLAWQIEGLQNYSIAGLPYITTDVGGYSPTSESDQELFVRWCQWGTFCPIYRVHGIGRPFPWQYGEEAEKILKHFDLLRYRLLPYIYANAGKVTQNSGTILRPLVMDFQDDPKALDTWDEFLFGPSLIVCPVYKPSHEFIGGVDQWADLDGKAGGVTATFMGGAGGDSKPVREELDNSFEFKTAQTREQRMAKSVRIEGTFTPRENGDFALKITGNGNPTAQSTVSINGQPVNPVGPVGDWQFPYFPVAGQAGVPIHFSIECQEKRPGLRFVLQPGGPQHRDVYLPGKNDWYDFWTGQRLNAGQTLNVETPLDRIPLYVRAGSIIPMGPELQYAAEKPADPIELRIYRGADGAFSLYEDEGDNYDYEKGAFSQIPITWNEAHSTLTIGDRIGSFPGMAAHRKFQIVWVDQNHGTGEEVATKIDAEISYEGKEISVKPNAN